MTDYTSDTTQITTTPDRDDVILYLPEITYLDTQVWSVEVGLTPGRLAELRTALNEAAARQATGQADTTPTPCICGYQEQQHIEDVCQTCGCGDYLEPADAHAVIKRWRDAALEARAQLAVNPACTNCNGGATEQADTEPDTCRTVDVDGTPVHVRGSGDWTDEDQTHLAAIVEAAKRKAEAAPAPVVGQPAATPDTDYDRDPAAIAWARAHVQGYLDRLTEFERQAVADDNPVVTYSCQIAATLARKHFLGDDTTIGALDERRAAGEAR